MASLPYVLGVLSDATKLKFSSIDSQLVEMLHQDISPANFTNFGAAWTEVDSGTNVNVDGNGVLTIVGNTAYGANGVYSPALTLAEGYIEFQYSIPVSTAVALLAMFNSAAALPATFTSVPCGVSNQSLAQYLYETGTAKGRIEATVVDTFYTVRIYVLKSADNTEWKRVKATVQGGIFTDETIFHINDYMGAAFTNPFYFTFQRKDATTATSIKLPKWYSGYSTAAPYVEYVHDAGAGKLFNNFDPSALAMPGTVPSTNLTFKWSFDDGVADYSAALTLAQLNAVEKQTANHRYIRIQVISNSDGATQVYSAKPDSATATDGVGDFPDVGNVRPADTVQLVDGTLANLAATDAAFLALEAGRNTDPTEAKVLATTAYKILGVDKTGSLVAISAPGAVTISSADGISSTAIRVNITWVANAEHIYIERATSPTGSFSQIADLISGNYFDDTVTAGQVWYYKARASNTGGTGAYGAVVEGTARTTNQIEQTLWSTYKTKMQADSYLTSYIQKWKFDKAGAILAEGKFPVYKSWILDTSEDWKGIPKSKIVRMRVIIHGLIKVKDSANLETEKLKFDEYVKNAIETDMTFAGGVTMNIVGDTIFSNLDDSTAEIFITCEILSVRFTAGAR